MLRRFLSEASRHGSSGFCRSLCAAPGNQDIAATRHPRLLWARSASGFINAEAFASPYGSCLLSLRSPFGLAVSRCGFSHRLPLWRSQHGLLEHQVNRPAPCNPRPFRAADAFLGGLPARLPSRPQDYRLMFTAVTSALSEPPCPAATAKTSHCDDHSARRGFSFISKGAARRQVSLFAIHRSANSDDGTGEMCLLNFELDPKTALGSEGARPISSA